MRTAKEWALELPESEREPFLKLIVLANIQGKTFRNLYKCVAAASTDWARTEEKSSYWNIIYTREGNKESRKTQAQRFKEIEDYYKKNYGLNATWEQIHIGMEQNKTMQYTLYSTTGYNKNLEVYGSFHNCQNFTAAPFENLLGTGLPNEEILKFISHICYSLGKRLMIVDIHTSKVPALKLLYPKFKFQQDYLSTNGSNMSIIMIHVK